VEQYANVAKSKVDDFQNRMFAMSQQAISARFHSNLGSVYCKLLPMKKCAAYRIAKKIK
jgi:hypothetical protein